MQVPTAQSIRMARCVPTTAQTRTTAPTSSRFCALSLTTELKPADSSNVCFSGILVFEFYAKRELNQAGACLAPV